MSKQVNSLVNERAHKRSSISWFESVYELGLLMELEPQPQALRMSGVVCTQSCQSEIQKSWKKCNCQVIFRSQGPLVLAVTVDGQREARSASSLSLEVCATIERPLKRERLAARLRPPAPSTATGQMSQRAGEPARQNNCIAESDPSRRSAPKVTGRT